METKVTFRPLTRGKYRTLINGVLGEITKNPKKMRFIIIRAHDNERIQAMKEEEKITWHYRRNRKYYGNWY